MSLSLCVCECAGVCLYVCVSVRVCVCASECVSICVCLKLQIKRNRNELKSLWGAKQTTQHTKPRRRRQRRISAACKEGSETVATAPSNGLQLTNLGVAGCRRCHRCCCSSCGLVAGSDPVGRARRSCESCSLSLAFSMPTFVPFGQQSARRGRAREEGRRGGVA